MTVNLRCDDCDVDLLQLDRNNGKTRNQRDKEMTITKIETGTEHLLAENNDGVAVLTLNRPEARNAMSGEMNAALQKVLADAELDHEIKCIVLTGAGKGFCAGGDVKSLFLSSGKNNLKKKFFQKEYKYNKF